MLKRVSIQNFKSLKDVTLDLQKVNLLIGPNNSGKSNFLKALEYARKDHGHISMQDEHGLRYFDYNSSKFLPINNVVFGKNLDNSIIIEIFFLDKGNFKIFRKRNLSKIEKIIESTLLNNEYKDYYGFLEDIYDHDSKTDELKLSEIFIEKIGDLHIYKPDPNRIMQPGPVGLGEEFVNADVSNIVGFLDLILSKYRKSSFQRIESDLNKCLPEFDEIKLDDYTAADEKESKGRSYKKIGLANSERGVTYWADELSEGTLYFLALLCIINQPNPPKLLLLEEPEKGIHPRRIEEVISLLFDLAEEKDIQVILTTHSPIVVDMFKDIPESVFIFDKDEEGATHVKNLQKDIIEPETAESERSGFDPPHYLNGLGQAWKVGLIGGVPR